MSRTRRVVHTVAVTLVLATLLAAPAAALQDIVLTVECPPEAKEVRPAGSPGVWECTGRMVYKSGGTGLSDPTQPAIVGFETPEPTSWMRPVVAPSTYTTFGPLPDGEVHTFPITVTVGVTQDAPAFHTENLWIRPYVIQNPRDEGELSQISVVDHTNLSVTPGFVSRYDARVTPSALEARPPDPLRYTIEIDNYSNGPTRFDFSMVSEEAGAFQPQPPAPLIVPGDVPIPGATQGNATGANASAGDTLQPGESSVSVPFEVQTPLGNGYANERQPLQLRIDSSYAVDPTIQGQTSIVTVVAQAQGLYVPGPTAPATALVLVAAAFLITRRRG